MRAIDLNTFGQVGFVVKDLEVTKRKFAELFGMEVPPSVDGGDFEVTNTQYLGQPAPNSGCKMAFFNLENHFQIELIQPNEGPSTWREFLETKGEGIHHIAFRMQGMKQNIAACEELGMKLIQTGEYPSQNGRYAYLDGHDDFKCMLELLEDDWLREEK